VFIKSQLEGLIAGFYTEAEGLTVIKAHQRDSITRRELLDLYLTPSPPELFQTDSKSFELIPVRWGFP